MHDAAGKVEKEDDIGKKSEAIGDVIENEEVNTDKNDKKEDKNEKENNKKLKLTVKENKTTKTINKMKNETPRSRLKSIDKSDKMNKKHAKQLGVNVRKISEFLLLNKGRENFEKPEKPAVKPAKQEDEEKLEPLSDNRMGGGGGGKLLVEKTFTINGNHHSTNQVGSKADYHWPDVDKSRRLSQ